VVGANAAWNGERARGSADFTGVARNTIMVVEVADSDIAWTEPRDLSLDGLGPTETNLPPLAVSSHHGRGENFFFTYERRCGANVARADGSMTYLPPESLSTQRLWRMLQIGGCREEDIDADVVAFEEDLHLNWPNIAVLAVWLLSVSLLLIGAVRSRKHSTLPSSPR